MASPDAPHNDSQVNDNVKDDRGNWEGIANEQQESPLCEFSQLHEEQEHVNNLAPGDFFGHESLLYDTRLKYSVRALTNAGLFVLHKSDIGELCRSNPLVAKELDLSLETAILKQLRRRGDSNGTVISLGQHPKRRIFGSRDYRIYAVTEEEQPKSSNANAKEQFRSGPNRSENDYVGKRLKGKLAGRQRSCPIMTIPGTESR
jgi:hypothetical protein